MEQILGSASIRRVGWLAFPSFVLEATGGADGATMLARLGRDGWFRLYFGRGRRVELSDGASWRIQSLERTGQLLPIVTCAEGKLAVGASIGNRSYGVYGSDYAFSLYRSKPGAFNKSSWILRQYEDELATFWPGHVHADRPIPLAAALLCFTLVKYGVPADAAPSVPKLHW